MNNKFLLLLIIAFSTLITLTAEESDWYLDKTIVDIDFENLGRVSENELKGLVREFIGVSFTDTISWEIMAVLYGLDYFDLVETKVEKGDPDGNTIRLIFTVKEKPYIEEIRFNGNNHLRRNIILEEILIKKNDIMDNSQVNRDKAVIEQLYIEKGFADVSIETRTQLSEDGTSLILVFEIEEGLQTKIYDISIVGELNYLDPDDLIKLMETKPVSIFNKGNYSESILQGDINNIRNHYRERGFIDAEIIDVRKNIVMDDEDQLKKMNVEIEISEGEPYTLNTITFSGNSLYTDEELLELFFIETGDSADLIRFERNYNSITDLYHSNGYIFNDFNYQMQRNEDEKSVSFQITVIERDRAHIENISIKGNTRTLQYVIQREIPIEVGDVFSKAKLQEAVMNLYNTGYFENIVPVPYKGSEELLMDLTLNVTEGDTQSILFGLTFSGGPGFPVSGQISWSDKNFLGTGKNIGVKSDFSFDSQSLSLSYNEPWLFGVRWNGGFDLSYNHKVYKYSSQDLDGNGIPDPWNSWEEYEENNSSVPSDSYMTYDAHNFSLGFSTGYTWMMPFARLSITGVIRSGIKYVDYDKDVYRPYNDSIIENYGTWKYLDSFKTKFSWDNRDLVFDPTKGYIISESITLGGILNSSISEYVKTVSRVGFYHTLLDIDLNEEKKLKLVLDTSSAFSYLMEKPWKTHELNIDDLGFSINGMFVGRGWNMVTGGKALWDTTIAIKYPVAPNVLSADVFLDGVGLWTNDEELADMKLSDFRFSAGAGFRFANPAFPIGIYWVKKFRFNDENKIDWLPEPNSIEFNQLGMDLVVAFEIDLY